MLQAGLGNDRAWVALYPVKTDQWLTSETASESLGINLKPNLKLAPISETCQTWLKSQPKPITIQKPETIEMDSQASDSIPLVKAFQDSLQDLLAEMLGSKIQIFPVFNQTNLEILVICSQIESERKSEVDIAMLTNISEMIAIAFQL